MKKKTLEEKAFQIREELKNLEKFRDTAFLKKFKRQLHGELSVIKEKLQKLTQTKESAEKQRARQNIRANMNRSSKNKRSWNYVKAIQNNYYPNRSLKELRTSLKNHKKGLETDVSDVAWRNPSP